MDRVDAHGLRTAIVDGPDACRTAAVAAGTGDDLLTIMQAIVQGKLLPAEWS